MIFKRIYLILLSDAKFNFALFCPILDSYQVSTFYHYQPKKYYLHLKALKIEQATDFSTSQMVESWKLIWIINLKNKIFWVCGFQISCIVCTVAATHPIAFVTRCYGALKSVSWSRPVLFAKQRRYDSCRTIIAAGAAADPILHYLLKTYNIYYNHALLVSNFQYLLH